MTLTRDEVYQLRTFLRRICGCAALVIRQAERSGCGDVVKRLLAGEDD